MPRPPALLLLTLGSLGCGANVVFGDPGDDGAGGNGGAADDGAGASPATGGAGAAGGNGPVTARIESVKLGADCMPEVPPDPIFGSVLVSYENLGTTPGSLELVRADLLFASDVEAWVFPLTLSPTASGTIGPGAVLQVELSEGETPGDASFVCSLCGLPASLTVTWRSPVGTEVTDQADLVLECAF